jgi:hypothetical protein
LQVVVLVLALAAAAARQTDQLQLAQQVKQIQVRAAAQTVLDQRFLLTQAAQVL